MYSETRNVLSHKHFSSEFHVDGPVTVNARLPYMTPPMWQNCQLMAGSQTKMLSWCSHRDWCSVCHQILWSSVVHTHTVANKQLQLHLLLFCLMSNAVCCRCCDILVWVFCMLYLRLQTGSHHLLSFFLVQNGRYLLVVAHTGECLLTAENIRYFIIFLCMVDWHLHSVRYLKKIIQEAQLSPRDCTTRYVSRNRAKCRTNVCRVAFDKSCNRRMTFKVIQGHWKWHESNTFPLLYTHNVVNKCHIYWWIGVTKVIDIGATQ